MMFLGSANKGHVFIQVRMAERSKALRSGRSPLLWAWVRIPLLTQRIIFFALRPMSQKGEITSQKIIIHFCLEFPNPVRFA